MAPDVLGLTWEDMEKKNDAEGGRGPTRQGSGEPLHRNKTALTVVGINRKENHHGRMNDLGNRKSEWDLDLTFGSEADVLLMARMELQRNVSYLGRKRKNGGRKAS